MHNKLNIGCGSEILNGYVNVDVARLPGVDVVHDLEKFPWPFKENQFDAVRMVNILEHLPNTIATMEEVWRVARDGAVVTIRVPYWNSWLAVADPTHRKGFHQKSFDFFDPAKALCKERPYYTHARFSIRRVACGFPLLPFGKGRAWVQARSPLVKLFLYPLAHYLHNIIWDVEFTLVVIKK